MFEKEVTVKKNKVFLTNSVADDLSYLSPRERERVRIARNSSQALGMHSARYFKSMIRMILMRDNEETIEDAS